MKITFKKYGVRLMQYQIELVKQVFGLNEDEIYIVSRRCGRNSTLESVIEFKLSLKK